MSQVMETLREAKADKQESARTKRFNEALEALKRLFPVCWCVAVVAVAVLVLVVVVAVVLLAAPIT
jgi:hypothetical protein